MERIVVVETINKQNKTKKYREEEEEDRETIGFFCS
jgi:hypothetical protein